MLTLEQLLSGVSEDEVMDLQMKILRQVGFQPEAWNDDDIRTIFLRSFARVLSGVAGGTVAEQTRAHFIDLSRGEFARLLARHNYRIIPNEPQATIGRIRLTSLPTAPLITWEAGDFVVSNRESANDEGAVGFEIMEGGSLSPGESAVFLFRCLTPGTIGNLLNNTALFFWGGPPDVSAQLDVQFSTWITTPGSDAESDERLHARMHGVISRKTYSNTEGAYLAWAREALPELTKVRVFGTPGSLSITIVGATDVGPITPEQIEIIEDYINGVTDGIGRKPINDILNVVPATLLTSPDLDLDVYVEPRVYESAQSSALAAVQSHLTHLPLGGYRLTSISSGYFLQSRLSAELQAIPGFVSVRFNSPTGDLLIPNTSIYSPNVNVRVYRSLD